MSIWFAESFFGLGLCKDSCKVGLLLEDFFDGGFSWWSVSVVSCRSVHLVSSDLHLYCRDAKLGPARKFKINFMSNMLGLSACCCGALARCNCCLEGYDPILLIFDVGCGKLTKIYLKKELTFLGYLLQGCFCQLFNNESYVLDLLLVEVPAELVMESEIWEDPL